jgi:DNA ligase-1
MRELTKLYRQTSTGAIQQWQATSAGNVVTTVYGQVGGKLQTTFENVKGKNLGKKNETSDIEQAKLKVNQLWDKKIKEGYTESIDEAKAGITNLEGVEPMLAFPFEKKLKHATFPALAQPKLDGFRALAIIKNGKATLFSRTQKIILSVPHINAALEKFFGAKDIILDGELYNHELKHDFNRLASLIKRDDIHKDAEVIQYHIYDRVLNDTYTNRIQLVFDIFTDSIKSNERLKLVQTSTISSENKMRFLHDIYTADGYEGLMYRSTTMEYENKRSAGLLKVKVMQDEEFKIIGVNEGKGREAGFAATFTVENNGKGHKTREFKATIARLRKPGVKSPEKEADYAETKEEYASRCAEILNAPNKFFGKMLTVQFQGRTPDGVPRFPVALRLREDL